MQRKKSPRQFIASNCGQTYGRIYAVLKEVKIIDWKISRGALRVIHSTGSFQFPFTNLMDDKKAERIVLKHFRDLLPAKHLRLKNAA